MDPRKQVPLTQCWNNVGPPLFQDVFLCLSGMWVQYWPNVYDIPTNTYCITFTQRWPIASSALVFWDIIVAQDIETSGSATDGSAAQCVEEKKKENHICLKHQPAIYPTMQHLEPHFPGDHARGPQQRRLGGPPQSRLAAPIMNCSL